MQTNHNSDDVAKQLLESRDGLLGYIRKKVSNSEVAEDILQDSLLRAVRRAPDLRDEEKLLPWFYRIINNAIIDYYRHRAIVPKYLEAYSHTVETVFEPPEHAAICGCMRRILPSLKPEYAMLIEQLELNDGSPEQVAEQLGITRNNLKVRRHRARVQLREQLEQTCRSCAAHGCLDCSCRDTSATDTEQ